MKDIEKGMFYPVGVAQEDINIGDTLMINYENGHIYKTRPDIMCLKDIFDEPKKNKIKKVNMGECTQITIDGYSIIIPNDMVDKVVNILTN